MAAHNQTSGDPFPEDNLARLLRDAVDGESPREEFVSSLGERLESELCEVLAQSDESRSRLQVPPEQTETALGSRVGRSRGRSLFALATAVVLVCLFMVWDARPSYSWASMLEAMEEQSWIQSDSGLVLSSESSGSFEQRLVLFLLSGTASAEVADQLEAVTDVIVLEQSWRWVRLKRDFDPWVELDVTLVLESASPSQLRLRIELDPDTQLPRNCAVIDDSPQQSVMVTFGYEQPVDVAANEGASQGFIQEDQAIEDPEEDTLKLAAADPDVATDLESVVSDVTSPEVEKSWVDNPFETPVSSDEMTRRVDSLMAAYWEREGVGPAGRCSDDEFFRRVYLDLTGRIPTVSECREFEADSDEHRRERLVEELLDRRDHATHLGAVWQRVLLPDGVDLSAFGGPGSFEEWLSDRFRDNMPYDQLVRQLLLAEGRVSEAGPMLFYTALNLEPEEIAAQTARAFLGIRLDCAQCHDHFFDNRLKQEDFWGFAAFFAQISQPTGKMDEVSPVLRVADTDRGEVMLPDTEDVVPPRFPLEDSSLPELNDASRREQLVEWMTASSNPHFARATVNRVWAHLFGRGLVEPVDDMRADNPSLCPEVLDELADYFVATGFDLRNLFRVLVSSNAYQQTSQSDGSDPEQATHFALMNIKTFTAEQLFDSIAVATRMALLESADGSVMRFQNNSRQAFLYQFKAPPGQVTDYQAGIPQALTLMNGELIQSATGLRSSGVLRSLQAPFFSDEQRIDTLFLATMSRKPDGQERQAILDYVLADNADRNERLSDVLWALLNSAEFTLNH